MNNPLVQNEPLKLIWAPDQNIHFRFSRKCEHLGVIQFSWKPRGLFEIQNINYTVSNQPVDV